MYSSKSVLTYIIKAKVNDDMHNLEHHVKADDQKIRNSGYACIEPVNTFYRTVEQSFSIYKKKTANKYTLYECSQKLNFIGTMLAMCGTNFIYRTSKHVRCTRHYINSNIKHKKFFFRWSSPFLLQTKQLLPGNL